MSPRPQLIVGNWKMNQTQEEIKNFFDQLEDLDEDFLQERAWIAPQTIHIPLAQFLSAERFKIGAQNCAQELSGAFTGETSAEALKDLGVDFTLVGHSERRSIFKEDSELLKAKTACALEQGLKVIFCVGENLEQRESDDTFNILEKQLESGLKGLDRPKKGQLIIAYEPVWAIGTGKTASPEQAQQAHAHIRKVLKEKLELEPETISILYGGSVKPSNIESLLKEEDIDGALVGGASLKPLDFKALCQFAFS
jgi:triosephosphate isomerase